MAGRERRSIAYAYAENAYPKVLRIDTYRVAGADGTALAQGMAERYAPYMPGESPSTTQVGGKTVLALGLNVAPPNAGQIFYPVGDVVFIVSAIPVEWAEAALALLP